MLIVRAASLLILGAGQPPRCAVWGWACAGALITSVGAHRRRGRAAWRAEITRQAHGGGPGACPRPLLALASADQSFGDVDGRGRLDPSSPTLFDDLAPPADHIVVPVPRTGGSWMEHPLGQVSTSVGLHIAERLEDLRQIAPSA